MTVINLNKARKARARSEGEAKAAEHRIAFGRTKAEKQASKAERDKAARDLSGHQREDKD
jgi:hypothetical protein